MAQHPKSGAPGNAGGGRNMLCAEWEALLLDYLDGALDAPARIKDAAAFEAHRTTCAACTQLLEESKRGGEWLRFLQTEPEVPEDLVARILAQTSGAMEPVPAQVAIAGMGVVPVQTGWLPGIERHAAQSRWIMTAAMAFFSIAFTLNLTGVKLTGFRLSDLRPTALASNLTRQFYVADAHVMRYYDNLRFVYELESRVRQMRQDVVPAENKTVTEPTDNTNQPPAKKPNDGSAPKSTLQSPDTGTPALNERSGEPVMASYEGPSRQCADKFETTERCSERTNDVSPWNESGSTTDRAERSLA